MNGQHGVGRSAQSSQTERTLTNPEGWQLPPLVWFFAFFMTYSITNLPCFCFA